MRGALQVMKHMSDDDIEMKKKMDMIIEDLNEKVEELDYMEQLNQNLIIKELKTNDELQEARKELIAVCIPFFNSCEVLEDALHNLRIKTQVLL